VGLLDRKDQADQEQVVLPGSGVDLERSREDAPLRYRRRGAARAAGVLVICAVRGPADALTVSDWVRPRLPRT
jgi:hypothetical protein